MSPGFLTKRDYSKNTEGSKKIEISPVTSLDMIFSKEQIAKGLIDSVNAQAGLRSCCSQTPKDRVSRIEIHL